MGSRRTEHFTGELDHACLSPNRPPALDNPETSVAVVQAHPHCFRLANKTVVLGPSGVVTGHTQIATTDTFPTETTNEQPVLQLARIPEPPCVALWSISLQAQGFSAEMADRIAAPQR